MKKRITLIVVIFLVVGCVAGGITWYVRRNTGPKLLARVELAIRANQFERALDLATAYVRAYPDDWQGHCTRARAFMHMGRFVDARQPLLRVTELSQARAAGWLLLANTYALPARNSLSDQRTLDKASELRKVIEDLQLARRTVLAAKTGTASEALDIQEYIGLNHIYEARARTALACRLEKDANLAYAAGSQSSQDEKKREADAESVAAEKGFRQARDILIDLVRKDVSRDSAASELVSTCAQRGDTAALTTVQGIIDAAGEATRPPIATSTLIVWGLRLAAAETDQGPWTDKLKKAASVLDQLLSRHPDREELVMARADVSLMQSDANTAAGLCQRVLKTNPRHAGARLCEARVLILGGKLKEAETKLFALVTDFQRWDAPQFLHGQVLASLGKKEPARKAMLEAVSINPANAEARTALVEWFLRDGRYRDAYDQAKALYETRPKDIRAVLLLAQAARDANEPDLAKAALNETRRRYANQPEFLVVVAEGYGRLGDAVQSRQVAEQAADIPSQTPEGRFARAAAMQMVNRTAEAQGLLEILAAEQPLAARIHVALAQTQWQGQRRMDALEHYRKAAALEDRNVSYKIQMAQALLDVGFVEQSTEECRRALDLDPGNPAALLLVWQAKVIRGEAFGAEPQLAQAGSADASALSLAMTCLNYGQVDKCIAICQAKLKKSPDSRKLRELLAQAYLQTGQRDLSLEEWKGLLRADPEQLRFYQQIAGIWLQSMPLAQVEESLGRLPEARKYRIDLVIADVLFQGKDFDGAAQACRRAATREGVPDDVRGRARLQAAMSLAAAGQPERALVELDALVAEKSWYTQTMLSKARLLHTSRRSGEAKAVLDELRKSVDPSRDPLALAPIAEAYAGMDRPAESLAVCEAMSSALPNDARPCLLRATILMRGGQTTQAQPWYRKAIELSQGDISTYVMLARSLEKSLDVPGALEVLRKMASVSLSGQVSALREQTALYRRQGLYQPAVRCLEELAARGYAEDPAVRLELGQAFAQLGNPQQAIANLQMVLPYSSQYVDAQQLLAELAETDEARLAILRHLAEKRSDVTNVLLQRMAILTRSGREPEATALFGEFLAKGPAGRQLPADAAKLAVLALCQSGKRREAADLCARMDKDTRLPPWGTLAALLLADQDPTAARVFLPDPTLAEPIDGLVGVVLCREDTAAARTWQARVELPSNRPGHVALAAIYRILAMVAVGDVAHAEAMLAGPEANALPRPAAAAQLVAIAKSDPKTFSLAATLLKALLVTEIGLPSVGRAWAMEVLKVKPDCELAADLAVATQPDESALKAIMELIQPGSSAALRIRAELLLRQGKFVEAAETFGQLARARKNESEPALRQGTSLERAGRDDLALTQYQEILRSRKDPGVANSAAYLLSQLFPSDASRLKEAMTLADMAVAAKPAAPPFRDTKGWIAYLLGEYESARQELRQAVTGMPGSAEVHYHLGLAESKGGSHEMALLHLEAAVALSKSPPASLAAAPAPAASRAGQQAQQALAKLESPKP